MKQINNKSGVRILCVFLALVILIAGTLAIFQFLTPYKPFGKKAETQKQGESGLVVTPSDDEDSSFNTRARVMLKVTPVNALSAEEKIEEDELIEPQTAEAQKSVYAAGNAVSVTAVVTDTNGNSPESLQYVSWALSWSDSNGDDVNKYMTLTTDGCKAIVKKSLPFGTKMLLTCTSTFDKDVSASVTLDCVEIPMQGGTIINKPISTSWGDKYSGIPIYIAGAVTQFDFDYFDLDGSSRRVVPFFTGIRYDTASHTIENEVTDGMLTVTIDDDVADKMQRAIPKDARKNKPYTRKVKAGHVGVVDDDVYYERYQTLNGFLGSMLDKMEADGSINLDYVIKSNFMPNSITFHVSVDLTLKYGGDFHYSYDVTGYYHRSIAGITLDTDQVVF